MPQQLEPTYRETFIKSWQVIIHHKLLWVLGAIALFLGQFGLGNFLGSLWSFITEGHVSLIPWLPREISWTTLSTTATWQLSGLIVIMFALLAFIIVVATCAQGTIVAATLRYFSGRRTVSLASAWHTGAKHFWRLLAVNVIQQIILLFTVSALIGFWRDFSHTDFYGITMLVIGLALGFCIAVVTSVLSIYTAVAVVDKECTLSEAVGLAYDLFKDHVLASLEISALLLVATIIPVVAIWIAAYIAIIPSLPFWFIGISSQSPTTALIGTFVAQIIFAILVALISGGFNAFTIASWTYCYRAMEKKGVPSRLAHHVSKIFVSETKGRVRVVRGRVS
jgi:hypothetical protein